MEDCLPHIICLMSDEYNVDNIIFSEEKETMMKGEVVDIFSRLGMLDKELKRLSNRKRDSGDCDGCEASPNKLFSSLQDTLRNETKSIFDVYRDATYILMKAEGCRGCRKSTKEDMERIGNELISIFYHVRRKAYGIIG